MSKPRNPFIIDASPGARLALEQTLDRIEDLLEDLKHGLQEEGLYAFDGTLAIEGPTISIQFREKQAIVTHVKDEVPF